MFRELRFGEASGSANILELVGRELGFICFLVGFVVLRLDSIFWVKY